MGDTASDRIELERPQEEEKASQDPNGNDPPVSDSTLIDTSPELQRLIVFFRDENFDVHDDHLELPTAQLLKTIVTLLLSVQTHHGQPTSIITNFLLYLAGYLDRKKDDFDISYSLAVGLEELIAPLYRKEHIPTLVRICELLQTSEEGLIRDEALKVTAALVECCDAEDVEKHIFTYVERIIANDWCQSAGIDLMAIVYYKLSEQHKEEYRDHFKRLIDDVSTMAKAAMARSYRRIITHYPRELIESDCIEMLGLMTEDIQGTVRVNAVQTAITLAHLLDDEDLIDKHICATFERLVDDNSWKVRLEVAYQIIAIQKAVKPKLARLLLVSLLRTLCKDMESLVRKCLAANIVGVLTEFKQTSDIDLGELFEIINELNKDPNDEVRNTLMGVIMDAAGALSADECRKYLLPLMKNTLMVQRIQGATKMEEQIVSNVNRLIGVLGHEVLQEELERFMFDVLSSESKWRTRRRLVVTLYMLALNAGDDYFSTYCLSFYKKMLNDHCYAVRRIVPMVLPALIGRYGFAWGKKNILNFVLNFHDHPAYFERLIVLYAIEELVAPSLEQIGPKRKCLPREQDNQTYLYKVYSLNKMLLFKLEQFEIDEDTSAEDTVIRSDLAYYGEDLIDQLRANPVEFPAIDALELLEFVMKYVMPIFGAYLQDKIVNVVLRTRHVYNVLLRFQRRLAKELDEDLYRGTLEMYTKESRQSVESNILLDLTTVDGDMSAKIEHGVRGKVFDVRPSPPPPEKDTQRFDQNLNYDLSSPDCNSFWSSSLGNGLEFLNNTEISDDDSDIDENDGDGDDNKKGQDEGQDENCNRVAEENDERKLLHDVDMNLFDDTKSQVLEFYSDKTSDAIDV